MNPRIKVAFFAEILLKDFDGATRTIYQIINRIDKSKFDFTFICGVPPAEDIGFPLIIVPSVTLPFNTNYKMAVPYLSWHSIEKKLDDLNPDIVHISTPSPLGKYALQFAIEKQIPTISIYHTHFISYLQYYLKNVPFLLHPATTILQGTMKKFYEKCTKVYLPTKAMFEEFSNFNINTHNVSIWQRGVDKNMFTPKKRNTSLVEKITGNNRKNILFASRLVWEKNLTLLINIFKEIQKDKLPYNVIIAGEGIAEEELKKEMYGAFFLGKLSHDKLSELYASCDVFLFPSITETYGNVVLEAMASGLPSVIANGGGTVSFIKESKAGIIVKYDDTKAFIEAIDTIVHDNIYRNTLIYNGLQYANSLSWHALVQKYFNDLIDISINKDLFIEAV